METRIIKEKIVEFQLCNFCTHKNLDETQEPCADCLDYVSNVNSIRPIHFELDESTGYNKIKVNSINPEIIDMYEREKLNNGERKTKHTTIYKKPIRKN